MFPIYYSSIFIMDLFVIDLLLVCVEIIFYLYVLLKFIAFTCYAKSRMVCFFRGVTLPWSHGLATGTFLSISQWLFSHSLDESLWTLAFYFYNKPIVVILSFNLFNITIIIPSTLIYLLSPTTNFFHFMTNFMKGFHMFLLMFLL